MKDISTSETGGRKRKQSDNSWLRKYKQLDVSILKNTTKIEKNEDGKIFDYFNGVNDLKNGIIIIKSVVP